MRQACGLLDLVRLNTARIELLEAAAQSGRLLQKPARLDHARKCGALWSKSGTAEPMVRGLTAGGKRIRTLGPRYIHDACETVLGAWCACAFRPERPTRSQGGPTVRIRFP